MKTRIFAILLAGLLTTTALTSCITSNKRPNGPGLNQTDESQTREDDTTGPIVTVTWVTADKTYYVTSQTLTLTRVDDSSKTIKANKLDELHCIKISSDGKRCIVEKDGVQYQVSTTNLTDADILGKGFTACEPKTMYANGSVNVRKYASSDSSFSTVIKTLKTNDAVTVVAEGSSWCKIKDGENYYFIFSANLSDTQVVDQNTVDYSSYFTELGTPLTLYVTTDSLNIRTNASTESDRLTTLKLDDTVTAVAQGVIDGVTWYKLLIPKEITPGQTPENDIGYATDKYLKDKKGTSTMTPADMLAQYPSFTEYTDGTPLYVSSNALNVRSTPAFPENGDNIIKTLVKKDQVKVIAIGTANENTWAMIELSEGKYGFVGYSKLTTDPEGNVVVKPLTLAELIAKHELTDIEDKAYVANSTVNCYTEPKNQTNAAKVLSSGDKVTVVASKNINYVTWYLFQVEGEEAYYFAGASFFEESTAETQA